MTIRELCHIMKNRFPLSCTICYHVYYNPDTREITYKVMDYTNGLLNTNLVFLFCTHGGMKTRDLQAMIESKLIEKGVNWYMSGKKKVEMF